MRHLHALTPWCTGGSQGATCWSALHPTEISGRIQSPSAPVPWLVVEQGTAQIDLLSTERTGRGSHVSIWLAESQDPLCVQIFPAFLLKNPKMVFLTAATEQALWQTSTSEAWTLLHWTVPLVRASYAASCVQTM